MICVLCSAANDNTVVQLDRYRGGGSDEVMWNSLLTLNEGQFVDLSSSSWWNASDVFINSSQALMVSELRRLTSSDDVDPGRRTRWFVRVVTPWSYNYTLVAFRRQYSNNPQLRHFISVVVDRASTWTVMVDNRRLDQTLNWTDVGSPRGGLVTAQLELEAGVHRLYSLDGRALSGFVYGYSSKSAYGCQLASVSDVITEDLWTSTDTDVTPQTETDPVTTRPVTEVLQSDNDHHHVTTTTKTTTTTTTTTTEGDAETMTSDETDTSLAVTTEITSSESSVTTATTTDTATSNSSSRQVTITISVTHSLMTSVSDVTSTSIKDAVRTSGSDRTTSYVQPRSSSTSGSTRGSTASSISGTTSGTGVSADVVTVSTRSKLTTVSTAARRGGHVTSTRVINVTSSQRLRQKEDHNDDTDDVTLIMFDLLKTVFFYAGLPVVCALLVVWFLCSQTTLFKRPAKCEPVTNERAMSMSRDDGESLSSSIDYSTSLQGDDTDSSGSDGISWSNVCSSTDHAQPVHLTHSSVDVDIVTTAAAVCCNDARLYVNTPAPRHDDQGISPQQKLTRQIVSLPLTVASYSECH